MFSWKMEMDTCWPECRGFGVIKIHSQLGFEVGRFQISIVINWHRKLIVYPSKPLCFGSVEVIEVELVVFNRDRLSIGPTVSSQRLEEVDRGLIVDLSTPILTCEPIWRDGRCIPVNALVLVVELPEACGCKGFKEE